MRHQPIRPNRPQLLAYPDSLGGRIADITALLRGPLAGCFAGAHLLPPFPSTGDRGFAPTTYASIEPAFGDWADIEDLTLTHGLILDVMVNHISRQSPEFAAYLAGGSSAPEAALFLRPERVWPDGEPPAEDLARIFFHRPSGIFSTFTAATGEPLRVWTTFGAGDPSEQIDLELTAPAARALVDRWLAGLAGHGVAMVRLDAVGYVTKKAGTSCFMVEPEIWEFLDWVAGVAAGHGLALLSEVHASAAVNEQVAAHGFWIYDFELPALVLHALTSGESRRLADHLAAMPERVITMLDCHDGIPVLPDLAGVLETGELRALADVVLARGGNYTPIITASHAQDGLDVHQLNISWYDALGRDDERFLASRALQLFARGIPQVYYNGLLAGRNDTAARDAGDDGRSINRHDYSAPEIAAALEQPVVGRLLALLRLRNSHPAFDGWLAVSGDEHAIGLDWRHGDERASLTVDLSTGMARVGWTEAGDWREADV